MESQQIMELLLAINENITTREDRKCDSDQMKAMQEKEEAERKSDREEMIARIDANTKATQATQLKMKETKNMKTMQENLQENLKKTKQMMNMNQAGSLRSLLGHLKKHRWYCKR
jgi:hypothetical protein